MLRSALLLALLLAAGCGKEKVPTAPKPDIMVRSEHQKQLLKLNDFDRAIALKRAILEQGMTCKQLVKTGYVGRYKNMDLWTATCSDKRQWGLFISANDSVQVRPCEDNAQLGLPACTIKPGTEGGTGLDRVKTKGAT
ncbi:MAG: hypothetical protein H0W65_09090 [Sphingomonas sp.]|uniref:hypothetical protein n=1 Tax=Sphingomonas sp. TaxID=28214 RepID=UPI00181BC4EF|nr:hypothetical protein [Sphingomonas sp.]MBA3667863.1 hypothetical protein [Sphingomonas sp.]